MDLSELEDFFGDRLVTSEAVRSQHSHDESWHVPENLPDAVVFPETSNEVSRIISFIYKIFFKMFLMCLKGFNLF